MNERADYIPISALQHYLYCPRQCALIHVEQIWTESVHTAEGRLLHEKAHTRTVETRGKVKNSAGLVLRSDKMKLIGQSDVVEFHFHENVWHPYPIEYKRGRPKSIDADRVQICAQALCLEEMLGIPVPQGALFYEKVRRRTVVPLDQELRQLTQQTAAAVHQLFCQEHTPPPPPLDIVNQLCPACSLNEDCLPLTRSLAASQYLTTLLKEKV